MAGKMISTKTKHRLDTWLKLSSMLMLMINAGLVTLLILMFYAAFTGDGTVIIHINNYNEMILEAYVVMPFIFFFTILTTIYLIHFLRKSL